MPPIQYVTKDWLKEILSGEKPLFKSDDTKSVRVALWDELRIDRLYQHYSGDKQLMAYMPPKLPKGKNMFRQYWFTCFNTLYPQAMQTMIR